MFEPVWKGYATTRLLVELKTSRYLAN